MEGSSKEAEGLKWAGLIAHPALIWEAILTAWAFRARRGLLPSRAVLRWRVATAYGSDRASPVPEDVVRFLEWRRAIRSERRRGR